VEPSYLRDVIVPKTRRQQPSGLRRGSAAVRLLGLWVRIPAWMSVSCEWCVSSPRRADNSSRGVLLNVVCPKSVISKPRKGRPRPGIESKRQKNNKKNYLRDKNARKEGVRNFKQQSVTTMLQKSLCHGSSKADYAEVVHI
jgi:hypothetical protein